MSHVDEGTLHAYLDGALTADDSGRRHLETHVAGCADCRARLDAERGVRDRAAHVLRQMAPAAVRVEPFESILAARRARTAAAAEDAGAAGSTDGASESVPAAADAAASRTILPRARPWFRMPLAAAATVVLAFTATWIVRSNLPLATPADDSERLDYDARTQTAPATLPSASNEAERVAGPAEPSPRNSLDSLSASPQREVMAATRAERDEATTGRLAAPRAPQAAPPPVVGDQGRRSVEEIRRAADMIGLSRGQEGAGAEAAEAKVLDETAVDTAAMRMINAAATAGWRPIERAAAAGMLGREPAVIEGVAIDSIHVAATADATVLIRIVQRVDDQPIEILQWGTLRDPATAAVLSAPPPRVDAAGARVQAQAAQVAGALRDRVAANEAFARPIVRTVLVAGNTVVLRALLPADSLTRIGERVR